MEFSFSIVPMIVLTPSSYQYCSLNDPNSFGDVDAAGTLALAGPQIVVAHLALHSAKVDPAPAGDNALLEDLPQDQLMQGFPLLRGE